MPESPTPMPPSADATEIFRATGRHPLAATLALALRERCRVRPEGRIAVATSGGGDSTALLVLLAALARRGEAPAPVALAIDHGLRPESGRELDALETTCGRLGLPFVRRSVRIDGSRDNLLALARRARYRALVAASEELGIGTLATAHQADDRLESILLGLGRGRGLAALAVPRSRRRLSARLTLVRPLLGVPHAECVSFLEAIGVPWSEDASNHEPRRARGYLRASVLPALVARWPRSAVHAAGVADELALAVRALEATCRRRFGLAERHAWPADRFRGVDPEFAAWALRRAAFALDPAAAAPAGRSAWRAAARRAIAASEPDTPPKRVRVGGLEVRCSRRRIELARPPESP